MRLFPILLEHLQKSVLYPSILFSANVKQAIVRQLKVYMLRLELVRRRQYALLFLQKNHIYETIFQVNAAIWFYLFCTKKHIRTGD